MHVEHDTPTLFLPPGACDCHAHVIGDAGYPMSPRRQYTPAPASEADYLAMLDGCGFAFGVLVQVSVYGTDNTCLVDALRRHPDRLRGVAVVDADVADAELHRLHAAGVRGVRINALYGGGADLEAADELARRISGLGWHLQVYIDLAGIEAHGARLAALPCPVVLDHLAHAQAADGPTARGFAALLDLASATSVWVKLSAANRLSRRADFADTTALVHALVERGSDRLLWGSDWPHVASDPIPRTRDLLGLLPAWVPAPATRRAILATNPARLYGFPGASGAA